MNKTHHHLIEIRKCALNKTTGPTLTLITICSVFVYRNSTVDELLRKNGARKRKLTNPIRAIQLDYNSSPNEMKQSMELFKAKEDKEDRKKKRAPAAEEEDLGMDLTNEILANNPLQALASKVFQFNPHFQNLQFNVSINI